MKPDKIIVSDTSYKSDDLYMVIEPNILNEEYIAEEKHSFSEGKE